MNNQNSQILTMILALLSWISVFALAWLMLMRNVQADWLSFFLFVFFLLVALFASSYLSRAK